MRKASSAFALLCLAAAACGHDFVNLTPVVLPDYGPASPYASSIMVTGLPPTLDEVKVSLVGTTHTWPDDLDILLVGPTGAAVMLMSDCGGGYDISNVNLYFKDGYSPLPDDSQIAWSVQSACPTDYQPGDVLPAPAPPGPYGTALSVFGNTNPNGEWKLFVFDDAGGDSGQIAGGWVLHISSPVTVPDSGPGSPYPSVFWYYESPSCLGCRIGIIGINVSVAHTWPDDVDVLLVGPTGAAVMLMSDAGGNSAVTDVQLYFQNVYQPLPDSSPLVSGWYSPTDYEPGDLLLAPAPPGPYGTDLDVFLGTYPVGPWSLYVFDDAAGDSGQIDWMPTFFVVWCQSPGDANCDGAVNSFDIDPFVLALTNPDEWTLTYWSCDFHCSNDINCDSLVNAFDIDPFVECLTGGSACTPCP